MVNSNDTYANSDSRTPDSSNSPKSRASKARVSKAAPKSSVKAKPKSSKMSGQKKTASTNTSTNASTATPTKKSGAKKTIKAGIAAKKAQNASKNASKNAPKKAAKSAKKTTSSKSANKSTNKKERKPLKPLPPLNPEIRADFEAQWQKVRSRLRGELGEITFNSWFKYLRICYYSRGRLTLEVPSQFIQSWIEANYLKRLLGHWQAENPSVKKIAMREQANWTPPERKPTTRVQKVIPAPILGRNIGRAPPPKSARDEFGGSFERDKNQAIVDMAAGAPLDKQYTFSNFITGASNELACANARRLAEMIIANHTPDDEAADDEAADDETDNNHTGHKSNKDHYDSQNFNPFFLYGGVGLGKTHLMHAIAHAVGHTLRGKERDCKVLYLSAEKFMYQFVRALRFKDMITFKQQFREVDVLMVDDIQFIAGKESTQEEFFHTFNTLLDHKSQVIISSDRAPNELKGIDDRIRSRLGGGMVVDIHPTDYELRLNILQAKADNIIARGRDKTPIPREVLAFLAQRITTNIRELEGALNRIVAYASFSGSAINQDMVREVLRDLLRAAERRVTIDEIQRRVADYYKIRIADMVSARRTRIVARPRQIAMYLAKELTPRSYPEIGRKFGGRDHSTVIHAVRRIKDLREMDSTLDDEVDLLAKMLTH